MSTDQYINSGILELYVAGVLTTPEMDEVRSMAAAEEKIEKAIKRIEETHIHYAAMHAQGQPENIFNSIFSQLHELPAIEDSLLENNKKKSAPSKNKEKQITGSQNTARARHESEPLQKAKSTPAGLYAMIIFLLVLFALSASLNYYLYQQWQQTQDRFAELQSDNALLAGNYETLQEKYKALQTSETAAYNSPDVKKILLKSQAPEAEVLVYWNPKSSEVFAKASRLEEAPAGRQYNLWAKVAANDPVNLGVITNSTEITSLKKIAGPGSFFITLERTDGGEAPDMTAVLATGNL